MPNIKDVPWFWRGDPTIDQRSVEAQVIDTVEGAIAQVSRFAVADAASGDSDFVNNTGRTIRVLDAWFVKTTADAAAANTIQVKNTAAVITNVMDTNVVATSIVRATQLNSSNHSIVSGGILRITRVKAGGNAEGILYVAWVPLT